ncbi:MAG: hypothetical protein JW712_13870 [Dehalococcoidales bacterium]|nr:hypothetical protein [Dehalococcoidales bacterium]
MTENTHHDLDRYAADLDRLTMLANNLRNNLTQIANGIGRRNRKKKDSETFFAASYQLWYSETSLFIRQVLPARLPEFEALYRGEPNRKHVDAGTYAIRDWLLGIRLPLDGPTGVKETGIVMQRFRLQCRILESARALFETALIDIDHILRSDGDYLKKRSVDDIKQEGFWEGVATIKRLMECTLGVTFPKDDEGGYPDDLEPGQLQPGSLFSSNFQTDREEDVFKDDP